MPAEKALSTQAAGPVALDTPQGWHVLPLTGNQKPRCKPGVSTHSPRITVKVSPEICMGEAGQTVQKRIHVAGLGLLILWKACGQGWPVAEVWESGFGEHPGSLTGKGADDT